MAKSELEKIIERWILQTQLGLGNFGLGGLFGSSSSNSNSSLMRFLLLQNLLKPKRRYYSRLVPIRRLNGISYVRI